MPPNPLNPTVQTSLHPSPTEKTAALRLEWVDYAKGIGIFLVVLGHSLQGLTKSHILPEMAWSLGLEHWIYSFHMPLFFFISGLFIERSLRKPLKKLWWEKFLLLGYPYLLWSLAQGLLQIATAGQSNSEMTLGDLPRILYQPIQQFWFLYVLFIVFALYTLARKCSVPLGVCLGLGAILHLLAAFKLLPGHWYILPMTCRYLIFFALGAWWGSATMGKRLLTLKPSQLAMIILGGYGLTILCVIEQWEMIPLVRFGSALAGTMASLALAIWLDRHRRLSVLRQWGILSLEIFAAHTIASAMLRMLLYKQFHLEQPLFHLGLSITAGLYGPILLDRASRRLKFPYLFTLKPRH
jgi:fucose 4-O-acetylase-like acetyltransferase